MSERGNVPLSQQIDAHKLESEGLRQLFKLQLRDPGSTVLYLSPTNTITWADQQWDEWPCNLTGRAQNSSGEKSRPKFSVANPEGVFSLWVGQGVLEGAILNEYEVLTADVKADARVYTRRVWVIHRPISLNKNIAVFECRSVMDGQNFKIPARAFYPPEYPHVSLQ